MEKEEERMLKLRYAVCYFMWYYVGNWDEEGLG